MSTLKLLGAALLSLLLVGCGTPGIKPDSFEVKIIAAGGMTIEENEESFGERLIALKPATTIPFIREQGYGIVYQVTGEPADASLQLKLQIAARPASTTSNKRAPARIFQPIYRMHSMGDVRTFYTTAGRFGDLRRPTEIQMLVVDMNGRILAREIFTIAKAEDVPDWTMDDAPPLTEVMQKAVSESLRPLQNR